MQRPENVAIFWDYENIPPDQNRPAFEVIESIRALAHVFGSVTSFKAYLELSSVNSSNFRSDLQASGVSLTECVQNGKNTKKDVAKMVLVDMMAFAIDNPAPATIFLISDDRNYAYGISILRFRRYRVVVLSSSSAHHSLTEQASVHLDWGTEVLHEDSLPEPPVTPEPQPQTPLRRRASSLASRPSFTPPSYKGFYDETVNEDGEDNPFPNSQSKVNHASSHDAMSWRQTTSRAPTSRPYSPQGSFRSAKSSPPSPPPVDRTTSEPTFITNGESVFRSSSQPNLPKGFPFVEAEPSHSLSTAIPKEKNVSPISTPAIPVPPTLAPVDPPISVSQPTQSAALPPVQQKLPEKSSTLSQSTFGPTMTPTPPFGTIQVPPTPIVPTPVLVSQKPVSSSSTSALSTTKPASKTVIAPSKGNAKAVPAHFWPLIKILEERASKFDKTPNVLRSDVANILASKYKQVYKQAGVSSFSTYILAAEDASIIKKGGKGNDQWIMLRPEWSGLSSTFPVI